MLSSPAPVARPSTAVVRLEVRVGGGQPAVYEVGDGGFLIGSVPGCDLRLPGANLAPVLCLIARQPAGASLRKLAPVQPIAVNGRTVTATYLGDGDVVALAGVEVVVRISGAAAAEPPPVAIPPDLADRIRQFEAREAALKQQTEELDADRVLWYRRRDEMEAECRRQAQRLEELREQERQAGKDDLEARAADVLRQEQELARVRGELDVIRRELSQRYQQRRDRLVAQHNGLRKAARKVQRRKQALDEQEKRLAAQAEEQALRRLEIEAGQEQVDRERGLLDEQHRLFASRQQEQQRDLAQRLDDLQRREAAVAQEKAALEKGQKQHQADLVRLDRIQATIEQRQRQLEQRALEIDKRFEQMQRDTRDLEEQAAQMDDWHTRLTAETELLAARKKEQEAELGQLAERAAALEGQQAMLATLRTRLERMREELRRQEQALGDQRALQEASEADIKERLEAATRLRDDAANEKALLEEERRRFDDRRVTLDQAVAQLRQAQEQLEAEQAAWRDHKAQVDATAAEQAEQAALLLARGQQLEELHQRLAAEKQSFRDREVTLSKAEQTLATLQEQLRRRSDELDGKQRQLAEREQKQAEQARQAEAVHAETLAAHRQAEAELEALRARLEARAEELEAKAAEVAAAAQEMEESRLALAGQRQATATERIAWELERQAAVEHERRTREEFARARDEAQALVAQLPELEQRADAAVERLTRAREQLREHLAEVHGYARQSREELEAARKQVQADVERVRQQELDLEVARDEHRLAVAAFRQQLIEWQGKVAEMRQALRLGSSQLERRQADLEQRQQQLASTTARLEAEKAELDQARRHVDQRRGEVDRHLSDMREWYRQKIRELAGIDLPPDDEPDASAPAVLSMADEVEPADRQLGDLLTSLELVDADTLPALWAEARRQRRSLRQLLLAGGYLTLYQLALIEAGNLDALVLGPVRVVDRLPSTPREAVYRVFDPRRNAEALLRHLAEAEMHDAVHPDEFRQRFAAAAAVKHPNVAGVLEVLDIAGRPAVLLEWVSGLPAADWPPLAAAPGVWFRLVREAARALEAAHAAGLWHGQLDGGAFVLGGDGVLKLIGLGEPRWLRGAPAADEGDGPAADLAALGRLAGAWAAQPAGGKVSKAKPMPAELQAVLARLRGEGDGFDSARALVEALDAAAAAVPASAAAWERLVRQAREQAAPAGLRQSA